MLIEPIGNSEKSESQMGLEATTCGFVGSNPIWGSDFPSSQWVLATFLQVHNGGNNILIHVSVDDPC